MVPRRLAPRCALTADPVEVSGHGWFRRADVVGWPVGRSDPQMGRALAKFDAHRRAARVAKDRHVDR